MTIEQAFAAYQSGRFDEAFKLLQPIAEQGNSDAQSMLGSLYQLGLGTEIDRAAAQRWYEGASQQGNAVASNNLAGMFETDGSHVAASYYYALARQQGFVHTPESPTLEGVGQESLSS